MFDPDWLDRLSGAIAEGCAADMSEASTGQLREVLINVQSELDCLQGLHARAVAAFEARDGHRVDGCGSMTAWLRRHLRMSGAETMARRRAAAALVQLPEVRQAVEAGRIRPAHVDVFATGVKRVGAKLMRDHQAVLLPVAEACDPAELLTAVDRLRDTIDPDAAGRRRRRPSGGAAPGRRDGRAALQHFGQWDSAVG